MPHAPRPLWAPHCVLNAFRHDHGSSGSSLVRPAVLENRPVGPASQGCAVVRDSDPEGGFAGSWVRGGWGPAGTPASVGAQVSALSPGPLCPECPGATSSPSRGSFCICAGEGQASCVAQPLLALSLMPEGLLLGLRLPGPDPRLLWSWHVVKNCSDIGRETSRAPEAGRACGCVGAASSWGGPWQLTRRLQRENRGWGGNHRGF